MTRRPLALRGLLAGALAFLLPGVPASAHAQDRSAPGDIERGGLGERDRDASARDPAAGATAPAAGSPGGERAPPGAGDARVEPPQLVEGVEAEYPPEARAARRVGTVVLKLLIDASGRVTEAEIATPAGHGFDEAARAAALRFRFTPARRGGTPVASRILYGYDFRLPEEPNAEPSFSATEGSGVTATGTAATAPPPAGVPDRANSAAPPPAREPGQTSTAAPIAVTVRGAEAERLRQSAQAITVIETEEAQRRTADMGEVLARTQGVGVRRSAGLGSWSRLSLNGLTDDQIRFFLDGVPLDLAGYPFGVANVPVNLVERVEIHRGVVPVRFGADALGGAVNLVTDRDVRGTHGAASYEIGSYDTHRLTLSARHLHEPSGFFTRLSGFLDAAKNDYPVDVVVPNENTGREQPARAYRFHDAYRAAGGSAELGFVNRPWARRLLLRAFVTDYDKEHQHKFGVMKVPYGEVTNGETAPGATLQYEQGLGRGVALEALLGYTYRRATFLDVSDCIYDWFGRCVRKRPRPGEDESPPRDRVFREHSGLGRLSLLYRPHPEHALRLSVSPTFITRTAEERRPDNPKARDRLRGEHSLFTWVYGVEHQLNLLDDRLENRFFVKDYVQMLRMKGRLPGLHARFDQRERDTHRLGVGDGLRYRLSEWLYAKASYEWATRLPRPVEVFGDGAMIVANLALEPETSHNGNLGFTIDARDTASGAWRLDANGFVRAVERLIVLNNRTDSIQYIHVTGARSLGVEAAAGWTSPGEHVALDGNITYDDFRKTSDEGNFARSEGERMPNRPWLFANGSARVQLQGVVAPRDTLSLTWDTRYVHGFYLGFANWGRVEDKAKVPSQLLHSLALTYVARDEPRTVSFTIEAHNLTDERASDFYGIQRPGRTLFSKATLEM
ncbi:TonB family protein [Sorangium cellulosum]|uniref:TonB family protein n=1 Tax=Sorangium cellulosum TaxID=56 RepID=A0A4P2Q3N0_SORCE|nr:TonB-dependent siderophore myxochelin receptor MxcH [Sorangium cellulosum]AUX23899.1 TonB family protein [Sorangium cellulosum]